MWKKHVSRICRGTFGPWKLFQDSRCKNFHASAKISPSYQPRGVDVCYKTNVLETCTCSFVWEYNVELLRYQSPENRTSSRHRGLSATEVKILKSVLRKESEKRVFYSWALDHIRNCTCFLMGLFLRSFALTLLQVFLSNNISIETKIKAATLG
jgi:hypothetical protein